MIEPKILITEAADILKTTSQNIHLKIKNSGLQTKNFGRRVYFSHNTAKKLFNYKFPNKIYSFQLVKGGVGKTVISLNFAIRAAILGAKVALIELDQQANLTRTLGVDARKKPVLIDYINDKLEISDLLINIFDGLDFIPSRVDNALLDNSLMLGKHPLDKVFNKPFSELKNKYDIIVIDCPPSIGSAVSAATLASDEIIMPITPTDYALAGLELTHHEILNLCEKYDKDIVLKILFNKFDSRTNLSHEVMKYVLKNKQCNSILLRSYIRSLQSIENCIAASISVFDSFKKTPEKEDFSLLTSEILGI